MSKRDRRAAEPEFVTRGDQPSAAVGHRLLGDPMAAAAMQREKTAEHIAEQMTSPTHAEEGESKVQAVRPKGNSIWDGRLLSVPVNTVQQVLSRDPDRVTFDITNQSTLIGGAACVAYLFGAERDAENFATGTAAARARALANGIHCVVLPDGAGRTFTHTASMFAVLLSASATFGVLDISAESKDRR